MKRSLFVVSLCLFASGALAAEESSSTENVSAEQHFVTKATQASLAEVEMGKLAERRSKDPAVQKFAAQMVKDHEKAREELTALAKAKNLTASTQLDREHSTIMHRLGTKPPSEFDSEYGKQMIEAHEQAVTLYSDAAVLRDKDLVAYAKKTLPTLKKHQQLAATLPAKLPPRAEATLSSDPLTTDPTAPATAAPDPQPIPR
jgi:putative membrane protein